MPGLISLYNMPIPNLREKTPKARQEILQGLIQSYPMLTKDPQYVSGEDIINSGFGAMPLTFAGKMALKAPKSDFRRAERMAEKLGLFGDPVGSDAWMGKNRKIWSKTGIHFAPDNKPRFEINDNMLRISDADEVASMIRTREDAIKELQTIIDAQRERSIPGQRDIFPRSLKYHMGKLTKKRDSFIDDLIRPFGLIESMENNPTGGMRASIMYHHPGLMENYPDMMDNILSRYQPEFGPLKGASAKNFLDVKDFLDPISTVSHELQHHIQGVEGFASGGDPMRYIDELRLKMLDDPVNYNRFFDPMGRAKAPAYQYAQAKYELLGGEAEARAVSNRLRMTPFERKQIFPLDSYDRPISDIVTEFNPMPPGVDWSQIEPRYKWGPDR